MNDGTAAPSALDEAIEIINRLLALCEANGLKREADEIATGEKLPNPTKRGRGAPVTRGNGFQRLLAIALARQSNGSPSNRGQKAALATHLAEAELKGSSKGKRVASSDLNKRIRTMENYVAQIPPQYILIATFLKRRLQKGDAFEQAESVVERMKHGDEEASRIFGDELRDLPDLWRKYKTNYERPKSHKK